jgi:hypothetical protein
MFKGKDPRSAIRDHYMDSLDTNMYQGDASCLDRTISRELLGQVLEVRKRLGSPTSKGLQYATLHPVVFYVDSCGEPMLAKINKPQLSGRDSTTEDDLLAIYLIVCEWLLSKGIRKNDFWFTGVGDDWSLVTERPEILEGLDDFFLENGIKMKSWLVDSMEKYHFLGADIVQTNHGPQPVWDLERSVVRLAYRSKKETDFVYAMRIVGVIAYNVYHPKKHLLVEYFREFMKTAVITNYDRGVVWNTLHEQSGFYIMPECAEISTGGSNLSLRPKTMVPKAKQASKRTRGGRNRNKSVGGARQSAQPKRKGRRSGRRSGAGMISSYLSRLTMCERVWLRALTNPFDPSIMGQVCYPSFPAKRSRKLITTWNGTVTIGTAGIGWIMYDPTIVGDATTGNAVYSTGGTYAGDVAAVFSKTDTGVASSVFSSPILAAELAEAGAATTRSQFRVNASGMQFRYTGTELNRGGTVYHLVHPNQLTLTTTTLGNAGSLMARSMSVLDGRKQIVALPPMHEEDLQWTDADRLFPWSDGGQTSANPFSALVFYGTPGNTFEVRIINHCEIAGSNALFTSTPSHVGDPVKVNATMDAAATATYGAKVESGLSYVQQFTNALNDIADSPAVKAVLDVTKMWYGYTPGGQSLVEGMEHLTLTY